MPNQLTAADVAYCQAIQKEFGKNYYFATKFFPKELREATYVLYAFFRVPDELVDNPAPNTDPKQELESWLTKWQEAYKNNDSDDPVLRATAAVHRKYQIPFEQSEIFLQAMIQDTWKDRYQNYDELKDYMDGSAAAVGIMMSYVIGFSDQKALPSARDLGYAMQLTNFLRDIKEDWDERKRIYLPLDELERHGISKEQIASSTFDQTFKSFMAEQTSRARDLYRSADEGIPLLSKKGRFPVRLASVIYEDILDELEAQNMNPFIRKANPSIWKKLQLIPKALKSTR